MNELVTALLTELQEQWLDAHKQYYVYHYTHHGWMNIESSGNYYSSKEHAQDVASRLSVGKGLTRIESDNKVLYIYMDNTCVYDFENHSE